MSDEIVMRISPDGTITTLYNDALNLPALGAVEVRRASEVEWEAGGWVATVYHGPAPCTCRGNGPCALDTTRLGPFPTRAEALAAEVTLINRRLAGR